MDAVFKNEQKVMARISFLVQHIIDKYRSFPDDVEENDEASFTIRYYNKQADKEAIITVYDNLSCHISVAQSHGGLMLFEKEFKEYNFLDEAFQLLRIPTMTNTNEGNIDELHYTDEQTELS